MIRGVTYFRRWGFSINEGAGPLNIHVRWGRGQIGFYVYALGKRWSWFKQRVTHD